MKRFFTGLLVCGAVMTAHAQTVLDSNKMSDNWSIGVNAGGTTPFSHSAFIRNMRPAFGINLNKQLTPVIGLTGEVTGFVNTSPSSTVFDHASLNLLGRVNLNNLFAGYKGTPRCFEIEAVAGAGWMRYIYDSSLGSDENTLASKVGLNFNFNLGESKAWTFALRPAIVYDLQDANDGGLQYNANQAVWEITAGLVYHFKNSNGRHYRTSVKVYNQAEVTNLNAQINALREDLGTQSQALGKSEQQVRALQAALEAAKAQAPVKVTETVTHTQHTLESVVTFRQGKTTIDASQLPNVERVATYLKNHANATVAIKGYASPEGSAEVNERIAKQRAEAVKTVLVNKYKVAANRVTAEGQGVGSMFAEPDWNRVSICTINED